MNSLETFFYSLKTRGTALLLLTIVSLCGTGLKAQNITAELIATVGDSNYYELKFTQSVSGIEALNLIVELEPSGTVAPTAIVDISNGCLAIDPAASFSVVHGPESFEFYWQSSVDGGIEVNGMIAEVVVVSGGIGIIDNIDAKRSGLAGNGPEFDLQAGPLPARESLKLQLSQACIGTVSLWNLSGVVVHQSQLTNANQYQIPTQALKPGIYFLRMEGTLQRGGHPVEAVRKVLVMH